MPIADRGRLTGRGRCGMMATLGVYVLLLCEADRETAMSAIPIR
jgi:hypothetical protein